MIITVKETKQWFDANLLKASIAWMKERNQTGRFSEAIDEEEEMLRSFFRSLQTEGEPQSLSSAA